jgi:uncharacterized protein
MSVSEESRVQPTVKTAAAPPSGIADPAPLGLAAFALTTFLLSAANAKLMNASTTNAWLGYALGYGGVVQLLAGMWEFRRNNVFGATAFSSYGGFWIGLFLWFKFVAPTGTPSANAHDLGWILLAFAIFNTYMLLMSAQVNMAVFGVFLTLEVTEILLFIGNFEVNTSIIKAGGYMGIVTAAVAWYASLAGLSAGIGGKLRFPAGRPLVS